MSETPNSECPICKNPITGESDLAIGRHLTCATCKYCNETIPNYRIVSEQLESQGFIAHETCHKTALFADFKNKVIPLTRQHIDVLNNEITKFYPALNPDSTDITALYDVLLSLKECAANVSMLLGFTREKLAVKDAQHFNHEQKQKRARESAEREATEKDKLDAQAKSDRMKLERENPKLRQRRLAVEGLVKSLGISLEQADAMVPPIKEDGGAN